LPPSSIGRHLTIAFLDRQVFIRWGNRAYFRDHFFVECEVWGAADGETIGIIAFREGWIDQLYVLPQHQGRGAGDALLRVAKAASSSLQLWTFQKNVLARRFYERRGFVAVKEADGSQNDEHEPDVLYRWQQTERTLTIPHRERLPHRGRAGVYFAARKLAMLPM
jgi:putative acetyltransferase